MSMIAVIAQIVIALGIVNVWVLRARRPTPYRPEGAASLSDEFRRYGLPDWMRFAVGGAKLTLAGLLLLGVWVAGVATPAALGMALLMVGAIAAHMRVGDPWVKSMPAASMLLLSLVVVVARGA